MELSIRVRAIRNAAEMLLYPSTRGPERRGLVNGSTDETASFACLKSDAFAISAHLRRAGTGRKAVTAVPAEASR